MKKPHLIQILSDEHFGLAMSCAGDVNVRTPNMDRLAAGGVRFEKAYANCPVCTPSRGTIFSGRHAHAGPVPGFFDTWKVSSPSTATVLHEQGYHSVYFGKWHCGIVGDQIPPGVKDNIERFPGNSKRTPEDRRAGFKDWHAFENINSHYKTYLYHDHAIEPEAIEGYQSDILTDQAIQYLQAYDRSEPLYLVLSIEPPHFPLELPGGVRRLDPASLTLRANCDDTPERRQHVADYYAMIENLDWNIGRLLDAMEALPNFKGEKRCVSYISDHGEMMGSHGLFCRKEYSYEEGIRIPAIFHWPGHIPAKGEVRGLFSLVDFASTLTALGGAEKSPWMQGVDWSPLLFGEEMEGPADVLLEMTESPMWTPAYLNWRGVTDGHWTYTFYENQHQELFDLKSDPYQQSNLSQTMPVQREKMRKRLLELLKQTREPFFDVVIEHGVSLPEEVHHLPPQDPDLGLPSDWSGPNFYPNKS